MYINTCLAEMTKHESRDNVLRSLSRDICGECSRVVRSVCGVRTYTFQRQGLERKLNLRAWTADTQFRWLHTQAVGGKRQPANMKATSLTFPFILCYSRAPAAHPGEFSFSAPRSCAATPAELFCFISIPRSTRTPRFSLPSLAGEGGRQPRRLINCSNLNLVTRRVPFNNAVIRQQRVLCLNKSVSHLAPNRTWRGN